MANFVNNQQVVEITTFGDAQRQYLVIGEGGQEIIYGENLCLTAATNGFSPRFSQMVSTNIRQSKSLTPLRTRCAWCGSQSELDKRGNCAACGGTK